jgi:dihydroorotase
MTNPSMPIADLVISGATVVTDTTAFDAAVAIKDGQILAIGETRAMPRARETFDASGLHLLPGAIDVHVHFREPGYTHKEDWQTGTAAAAMGGVTTVFEMPNVDPPTGTPAALARKLEAAKKAHVDYGLYGLLAEDTIDQLQALIDGGVAAFKCFMGNTFGNLPSPSTGVMLEGFEIIAKHGLRIALHAETASIMAHREKRLQAAGRTDPMAHLASRPAVVAIEAVSRAAILAEWTGARIHILHISSADELRPLREAKARGVDVTCETCPHYLLFDEGAYADHRSVIRVNPPVRERRHQTGLWEGLRDGTIDMIATDHAPHSPAEKLRNDIWTVDCGFRPIRPRRSASILPKARSSPAPTPTSPSSTSLGGIRLRRRNSSRAARLRPSRACKSSVCRFTHWCAVGSSCKIARSSVTPRDGVGRSTAFNACRRRRRRTAIRRSWP